MIEIVIPQVGEAIAEVTLLRWLKKEGEAVHEGDVLFEVDTDKAVVEVEAFANGRLQQILAPDGSAVLPRQVVALLADDAMTAADSPAKTDVMTSRAAAPTGETSPVARRLADDLGVDLAAVPGTGPGGRVMSDDVRLFATRQSAGSTGALAVSNGSTGSTISSTTRGRATPKAHRVAREHGVDLSGLVGTGVDGLVTADDVQAAVSTRSTDASPAPVMAGNPAVSNNLPPDAGRRPADTPSEQQDKTPASVVPLSRLRQAVATKTQQSKGTVPHFYLMADVDMTQARRLRAYCRDELDWDRAPTYTDLLVRACALALAAMPSVNASYGDAGLTPRQTIDIGVAVDIDGGLIAPVLPGVDRLSLTEVSVGVRGLAARAREGRLREADLSGKSMVVSNLGMCGVDAFVAIIDVPDPMILAVGRVAARCVPVDGAPAIRPMCTLTLSVDHRAMDGAPAARFLARVKAYIEYAFELLR